MLYAASLIGVGLGVLSSVLNTSFLDPKSYGDYRYVFNIISLLSGLLLFGYFVSGSRLLALSDDQSYRKRINGAMILILIFVSFILIVLMAITGFFFNKGSDTVKHLCFTSMLVCASPLILNYINTTFQGENRIKELSWARLLPYFIYLPIGYIVYSTYGATPERMMLLQNGAAIIVYITLIILLKPSFANLGPIFKKLNIENKEYGWHVYTGAVLAVSLANVSGVTIGIFEENNTNVGFYSLALTVASPLMMLPAIVGTTHFKEFARQDRIPLMVFKRTLLISIATFVLFTLFIIPLVKFLYSEKYSQVGYYAIWMAVAMTMHGFGDMINRFLGAHGKGREIRNSAVCCGLTQLFGSFVFVYFWGIYGAIATRILASGIYMAMMLVYYKKIERLVGNNPS